MKIHLWVHHYEDDPSLMPDPIAATSEYVLDAAGDDFWQEEREEKAAAMGPGTVREIIIEVPDDAVLAAFATPVIEGSLPAGDDRNVSPVLDGGDA